jgi:hypothetical protein
MALIAVGGDLEFARALEVGCAYSITSSARARRDAGISIPSNFAVLRLMVSKNLVGCSGHWKFAG